MSSDAVRDAIDVGDVDELHAVLRRDRGLVTALVAASGIEPTSPLTYVGMARFYGFARHDRTGALARVLLEAGADKDDETKNGAPLYCAASHGDADVVRVLLDAGADVDLADPETPSETALRAAAAFGWPEIVDMLVAKGAEPRSVIEAAGAGALAGYELDALSDRQRANAFRAAAVNDRLGELDRLLAAGVSVDAESDGRPAIHWARQQGREQAVRHLIARGATDPEAAAP